MSSKFAGALQSLSSEAEVRVRLDPKRTLAVIPPDFIGLGYEISLVARPGLLNAHNSVYVQLVRTLGAQGVIRVGGNTADYASYSANGAPLSSPEGKAGSVVNDAVLRDLGTFLDATGWKLIWALNLGNGKLENAIAEAKAVSAATRGQLLAFEIGNEPDLFSRRAGHRGDGYGYEDYLREYRTWRDVLRKAIPQIALAGPDAAVATEWVTRFAADEGKDVKLLTHHYYREGQNPTSSIDKLLHPDPKLDPMLEKLKAASESLRSTVSNLRDEFVFWRRQTRGERHAGCGVVGAGFHVPSRVGRMRWSEHGDGGEPARVHQFVLADQR